MAIEQAGQDHARERHRRVERPADQLVELVLVHLLVVADRHARTGWMKIGTCWSSAHSQNG